MFLFHAQRKTKGKILYNLAESFKFYRVFCNKVRGSKIKYNILGSWEGNLTKRRQLIKTEQLLRERSVIYTSLSATLDSIEKESEREGKHLPPSVVTLSRNCLSCHFPPHYYVHISVFAGLVPRFVKVPFISAPVFSR